MQFSCSKCGECCRGLSENKFVILFPGEDQFLAEAMGIPLDEFDRFTAQVDQFQELGVTAKRLRYEDGACVFLDEDNLCKIHKFKPYQCRMGPDNGANVVDDKLRVYGVTNIRVADASIFPTIPSGNTNAPALLVGEKASDIILQAVHA